MKKIFIWIVGLPLVAALGLELYTRLPTRAEIPPLNLPADTQYAVLFLHGTNGKDEPLLIEAAETVKQQLGDQPGVAIRYIVWSPWSDNRLRAGINGRKIGKQLGQELADLPELKYLRLIVHSAGAYTLTPLCEAYRNNAAEPGHLEMTYLDGMGIRGGWDYFYGYRHYGECADFSMAIINTDETVPGTNAPLVQSYNIDVTAHPARQTIGSDLDGHHWPIRYFIAMLNSEAITPGQRSYENYPRGTVSQQ
ncbi:MAG: hypothetical protein ACR2P6_11030 [Gammaproteobacteria bacterium]